MKIKTLLIFNHIFFIYGIILSDLTWLWLTFVMLILIGKIGGEIYMHRYVSHKSFTTTLTKERIMLILSIFNCMGSPLQWAGVHRKHHANADVDGDPHGNQSWWRVWSTYWKPLDIELRYVKDIIRDKQIMFVHNHYFKIVIITMCIVGIIDWQILAFGICGASVLSFHQAGLVNVITHRYGYRNYNTKDNSTNNSIVNFLSIGSGLHNNHHAFPSDYRNNKLPHEYDVVGWIIEKWFLKNE